MQWKVSERMSEGKDIEAITRQVVEGAKARFGDKLSRVLLYGSYVRGDYNEESDIDIMILADIDAQEASRVDRALTKLASRLDLEYDVCLSLTVKDSHTFDAWVDVVPFYKNVNREGVLLSA
jgi:predicted nucleotidyltransferase